MQKKTLKIIIKSPMNPVYRTLKFNDTTKACRLLHNWHVRVDVVNAFLLFSYLNNIILYPI